MEVKDFLKDWIKAKEITTSLLQENNEENAYKEFDTLSDVLPGVIVVYDLLNSKYLYVGKGVKNVLGVDRDFLYTHGVEGLLGFFPGKHQEIFLNIILPQVQKVFEDYHKHPNFGQLKISYQLKFLSNDGQEKWSQHKFSVIEVSEEGMPILFAKYFDDISEYKKDNFANFIVSIPNLNGEEEKIISEKIHVSDNNDIMLSNREVQVLNLVSQGMSNQEIGDKLFISKFTVDTHKKNMLKKVNVRTTPELVKLAVKEGVI